LRNEDTDNKTPVGELAALRLFSVANSDYYGKLRSGKSTKFVDVVTHLGVDATHGLTIFRSFTRRYNVMIESAMPDSDGVLHAWTAGSLIAGQFQSIGLSFHALVAQAQLTEQVMYLYERRKKLLDSNSCLAPPRIPCR
jgi:hypothetical protein